MRRTDLSDADCAIAQALDVVGDWWTLLVVRDVARGVHRFEALCTELGMSRKVLAERLRWLLDHGVLRRERYHEHPPRYEYRLTDRGRALLPVLVALQDWGATWLLGDGTLSATSAPDSAEARRVRDLVGARVPDLLLPAADSTRRDPIADSTSTVVYFFPGAGGTHPPGWDQIPGAPGCTLEACAYRDRHTEFAARGATVHGVSTQRPDELAAFTAAESLPFPLFSDAELALVTALRLPTFRAGGVDRLKRLTLVVDRQRIVRSVLYPIPDAAGSVQDALALVDQLQPT
ncbi:MULTISPECIES: winged helix-turn-helix transcriptional regulator [unclassified Crossiella]|uniref:winged helix-turn-helix transcriptional regulator n=1 Tax=unclassified Crossiella TaxID=2620835 RepID=UPI001FFE7F58|nr:MULTISPECIES: winged helix-turn-helix transcriptional regulator [unclassified Crossiella]MCK2238882.1 winged helix-turn-helix transcriptional regulator [Crossiella sp. S99.2]MCK2251548.1 winged helix-turn-helix transcriptional regulator [Crossiella sp. S99.1]